MSSTINTNGLDVNYPIPGRNNNTQGFRNNFTNIKTNLDTAANEISDLENKVVLKSALANSVLNNDMANTLISNASTLGFRATTYNLGNALAGTIVVDSTLGDVQYGTLQGNISLQFGGWAPTGTQSELKLQLGRANANVNYNISFPTEAIVDKNHGFVLLENYSYPNAVPTISFPVDVTQLNLTITSNDCGNSLFVEPTNRPFISTQIQTGTPPSTGKIGDTVGTVYVDPGTTQLVVTGANTDPYFTTSNTASLYTGLPVVFTGTSLEANIVVGNTYYVRNVVTSTRFTVSSSIGGANIAVAANATGTTMLLNPVQYIYVAVQDYNATANNITIASTTAPNVITVPAGNISAFGFANNQPVIFTGNVANINAIGLEANTVYYIKGAWNANSNITVSQTRYNGVAGPEYQGIVTVATDVGVDVTSFTNGSDIFRRVTLNPF
jgi:hypothetical protein